LAGVARECLRCRLRESCSQVVFGEGPPDARLMLIGEGPGQDEDIQGRPFVGKAGQLLDKILEAAGIQRSQVYIGNVVKCRPPGNRLPNPDEVKERRKYLERQIKLIRPSIIVCLGSMASQTVIDPNAKITRIRGRWLIRQGIKIMPTYHPAALLRNPSYKRPVWEDFKQIRDEYRNCR
jgi:uracil-DNA glycosylase family 4